MDKISNQLSNPNHQHRTSSLLHHLLHFKCSGMLKAANRFRISAFGSVLMHFQDNWLVSLFGNEVQYQSHAPFRCSIR
ncbi:hypothetical protein T01_9916 [Trichinella spiralis]|uniref:Uncharacterized protein n=1 Tax=Trichinella spiralis TaxID=6334 RepID=A0A0V1ANG4_TRISP|nr:hypothetical protein T01_9916 [Trichinella spiralis]